MSSFQTALRYILLQGVILPLALCSACGEEVMESRGESLIILSDGVVYSASITQTSAELQRISPPEEKVQMLAVLPNGKSVWLLGDQLAKSASGLSYQGLEVRFLGKPTRPRLEGCIELSPDGEKLAYVARVEAGLAICCEDLSTGKIQVLSEGWRVLLAPAWSPDGKMIAYYCTQDRLPGEGGLYLHVVDMVTGRDRQVAPRSRQTRYGGESRNPPVWSNASDKLYFEASYEEESAGPFVYEVALAEDRKPALITRGHCYSISAADDTIYIAHGGIRAVTVRPVDGQTTLLVPGPAGRPQISPSGRALAFAKGGVLYCRFLREGTDVRVLDPYSYGSVLYWLEDRKTEQHDGKD